MFENEMTQPFVWDLWSEAVTPCCHGVHHVTRGWSCFCLSTPPNCNVTFGSSQAVNSHSRSLASCTMLEQMKSRDALLISDFSFLFNIPPLTFHQNISAGSGLWILLLKY